MADNTKQYTAIIDVEVEGQDNVKNLGDDVEDTDKKFVSLRSKIREAIVELQKLESQNKQNSKEFQDARKRLDELNDAQERVNFQAGQFDDKLASLPGPLGQVGGAIKTFNESVNKFGTSLTVGLGVIGLVITAFFAMKKALESTKDGQQLLTRVTTAFQKALGPLLAIVEKLAIPVFEALAKGLEYVAVAFEKVADYFDVLPSKVKEAQSGVKDFQKEAEELAEKQKAAAEKAKAAAEKAAAEAKARREKAAAEQAEFEKQQTAAALALLEGREREIAEETVRYTEQAYKYRNKTAAERQLFEDAYRKKIAEIDKKYDDEAAQKTKERYEKEQKDLDEQLKALDAFYKKQEDLKRYADFAALQQELETLDATNAIRDDDFQADQARLELKFVRLQQQMQLELDATKGLEDENIKRLEITKKYGVEFAKTDKEITDSKKAELQARADLEMQYVGIVGQAGRLLSQAAGDNKTLAIAGILLEQASAIASIAISTQKNAAKAGYFTPKGIAELVAGGLGIASAIVAAKKGIDQINQVKIPGGGGGGGSSGAPNIPSPTIPSINAPRVETAISASPGTQIAGTLAETTGKPIKAYVVSGDVSSQQALDRRTTKAATF
jgi:FtsZ-binding cell division protein ZapB